MGSEGRKLVVGATWTLVSTLVSLAAGLSLRPIIVAYVGLLGYGIWASSLAMSSMFALLGDLGMGGAVTKYASERIGKGDSLGSIAGSGLALAICVGGLAGLGLIIASPFLGNVLGFPGIRDLFVVLGLQLPINAGLMTLLGLLQGRRELRSLASVSVVQNVGNLLLTLGFLFAGFGLVGAVLSPLACSLAAFLGLTLLCRQSLHFGGIAGIRADLRRLVPFGTNLCATNAVSTVMHQLDVVILALWVGDATAVGTYALAVFVTRVLWIIPGSVGVTTFPAISQYHAAADSRRMDQYVSTVLRTMVAVTGVLTSGLLIFGRPLIGVLFGGGSVAAYDLAILLLPGTAFLGCMRSVASSIPGVGRPEIGTWISMSGAGVLLVLSLALVPTFESTGAATAVSIAFATVAVLLIWIIARHVAPSLLVSEGGRYLFLTSGLAVFLCAVSVLVGLPSSASATNLGLGALVWGCGVIALFLVSGGRQAWLAILQRRFSPGAR